MSDLSLVDDLAAAAAQAIHTAQCGCPDWHPHDTEDPSYNKAGRAAVAATLRQLSGLRGNGLNNLRTANLAVLASVVERDGDTQG